MYIDYEYYTSIYGAVDEADFNRVIFEACRRLDIETTGIDGYKKLKYAFPVDEDDAECVKRCVAKICNVMLQIEEAESHTGFNAESRAVASVSAGSESITYVTNQGMIASILSDKGSQDRLYRQFVEDYLRGITDANGVNLLYMGSYPRVEVL